MVFLRHKLPSTVCTVQEPSIDPWKALTASLLGYIFHCFLNRSFIFILFIHLCIYSFACLFVICFFLIYLFICLLPCSFVCWATQHWIRRVKNDSPWQCSYPWPLPHHYRHYHHHDNHYPCSKQTLADYSFWALFVTVCCLSRPHIVYRGNQRIQTDLVCYTMAQPHADTTITNEWIRTEFQHV